MSEKIEWRCFHCRQVFTDYHTAQAHFGKTSTDDPECLKEFGRLGPLLLTRSRELRTALEHIQHMAAFISSKRLDYSFESLSEDVGGALLRLGMEGLPTLPSPTPNTEEAA